MPTSFLLIRHAESIWNASGRWQGHADPPLSERGVGQAEALAARLVGEPADRLLCSDLQRARHTAEIVGRALDLVPESDARLRELDVGRWEGLTRGEIAALDAAALARFDGGCDEAPAGGGESRAALRKRILAAFAAITAAHAGERIAVVAHLGVIAALAPGAELGNAEALSVPAERLLLQRD